jgi:predicted enzyme related to lactoylglutathione lyase
MCISGVLPQAVTFGAPRPGAQKLKDILAPASPVLPYIWVDDIDATLALVAAHGGEIVEPRRHDTPGSTSWIATFRDPAGNLIGLYQESPY